MSLTKFKLRTLNILVLTIAIITILSIAIATRFFKTEKGVAAETYKYKVDYGSKKSVIAGKPIEQVILKALNSYSKEAPAKNTFYMQYAEIGKEYSFFQFVAPKEGTEDEGGYKGEIIKLVTTSKDGLTEYAISEDSTSFEALLSKIPAIKNNADKKMSYMYNFNKLQSLGNYAQVNTYKFPWGKDKTFTPTAGGWHRTWNNQGNDTRSIDFLPYNFSGETPEYAVVGGVVTSICNTGSNGHGYVVIQADNEVGPISILHIRNTSITVKVGDRVTYGQQIGVMHIRTNSAFDGCGYSTAPHIHIEFPVVPFVIDGYTFTTNNWHYGEVLKSTNGPGTSTPTPTKVSTPTPTKTPTPTPDDPGDPGDPEPEDGSVSKLTISFPYTIKWNPLSGSSYAIELGTSRGEQDLYSSEYDGDATKATINKKDLSDTVTSGESVYLRLWTNLGTEDNTDWQYVDYDYIVK